MSTIQTAIEEINQAFPTIQESQIIIDLGRAQNDFVQRTQVLESFAELTTPNANLAWVLPADFNSFKRIDLYDVNGNPLYFGHHNIDIGYQIEFGNIYFYSLRWKGITGFPSKVATAILCYYNKPTALTAVTSNFSVIDEHIIGVSAKVYQEYYAKFPVNVVMRGEVVKAIDHNMLVYWQNKSKEYEIEGKRYHNKMDDTSTGEGQYYGVAGDIQLPKRNFEYPLTIPSLAPVTV